LPDAGLLAEFLYNVMRAGLENLLAVPEGDTPNFWTLSKKTSALQRQICTQPLASKRGRTAEELIATSGYVPLALDGTFPIGYPKSCRSS
jgi:hypothetical protein